MPSQGTRPTSERAREGLFGALDAVDAVRGARVLDLYAGTGALGFEALSRGAAAVRFVEAAAKAATALTGNATELGVEGYSLRRGRVAAVLREAGEEFDLVLLDPPYDQRDDELAEVLGLLLSGGWCAEGALVIVERSSRAPQPRWPAGLSAARTQRYGETALHWAEHA